MAKISGPLLSNEAHGRVSANLTFSLRSSGNQVRYQKNQKDRITADRTTQREYYQEAVASWHTLTSQDKQDWVTWNNS